MAASVPSVGAGRRRRWLGLLLLAVAVGGAVKYGRTLVRLDNFAVVEPGQLYRSGQLWPWQLQRVIREQGLRTVINTREPEAPALVQRWEAEVCRRAGVRLVRLPMAGDGRGSFAQYDEALAVLDAPANRPALVHCARGSYRTGAVIGAWRVLRQGWTPAAALEEMRTYRVRFPAPALERHVREYWQARQGRGAPRS